jgi:hypothetical protein
MQTNATNANKARPAIAAFDLKALGAGKKVEIAAELSAEFVPDKPGFEAGTTLAGVYENTKKVVSEKLTTSKRDENGRKYRLLHVFRDAENNAFGIWGTGILDALMKSVSVGNIVAVTYKGRAAEPLQKGQQPPMEFDVVQY